MHNKLGQLVEVCILCHRKSIR